MRDAGPLLETQSVVRQRQRTGEGCGASLSEVAGSSRECGGGGPPENPNNAAPCVWMSELLLRFIRAEDWGLVSFL